MVQNVHGSSTIYTSRSLTRNSLAALQSLSGKFYMGQESAFSVIKNIKEIASRMSAVLILRISTHAQSTGTIPSGQILAVHPVNPLSRYTTNQ